MSNTSREGQSYLLSPPSAQSTVDISVADESRSLSGEVHVCMCVCVHVCMCLCVYVFMCACVYVCMCLCVYVCMCACAHVFMCAYVCIRLGRYIAHGRSG